MELFYDLHIHSCLSPCGDQDMTPGNIVGMAAVKGLDIISITDHNSCKNVPAAMKFGNEYGILVIPGMELTTSEEVHILCFFRTLESAMDFDSYVSSQLIPFPNNEKIFGRQSIMDSQDTEIDTYKNLLINATTISYDNVFALMKKFDGAMIPAHIDKNSNSLLSNLGFIPPDSQFTCVEIRAPGRVSEIKKQHPYLECCNVIHDSDAHYLEDIKEPLFKISAAQKNINAVINSLIK